MTQEHLTPEQIQRFALPTSAPDAERTRANAHIQSCLQCRLAFEAALHPLASTLLTDSWYGQDTEAEECLDAQIIARYAQGAADSVEADIVEMHTETCALCRSQVAAQQARYKTPADSALQTAQTASTDLKQPAAAGKEAAEAVKAPVGTAGGQVQEGGAIAVTSLAAGAKRDARPRQSGFRWGLALGGGVLAAAACGALLWLHPGGAGQTALPNGARNTASGTPRALPTQAPPRVDSPNLAEQRMASLARRGERTMGGASAETIALIGPDGVLVNSLRPAFRWKTVPHAAAYQLTCIPQRGKDNKNKDGGQRDAGVISYTVPADAATGRSEAAWTIPATQPALQPAVTYTWIVRALDADKRQIARSSTHEELFFRTPATRLTPAL